MKNSFFWLVAHSVLAFVVTLTVCSVWLAILQIAMLAALSLATAVFSIRDVSRVQQIRFGMITWVLGVCTYASLILGACLGSFGRFTPLELILATATLVSGCLMLITRGWKLTDDKKASNQPESLSP